MLREQGLALGHATASVLHCLDNRQIISKPHHSSDTATLYMPWVCAIALPSQSRRALSELVRHFIVNKMQIKGV
jgi:hypothetical protein